MRRLLLAQFFGSKAPGNLGKSALSFPSKSKTMIPPVSGFSRPKLPGRHQTKPEPIVKTEAMVDLTLDDDESKVKSDPDIQVLLLVSLNHPFVFCKAHKENRAQQIKHNQLDYKQNSDDTKSSRNSVLSDSGCCIFNHWKVLEGVQQVLSAFVVLNAKSESDCYRPKLAVLYASTSMIIC